MYFHIYRDGIKIWPIGIITVNRIKGFGIGFWKERMGDLYIGLGFIFRLHIIQVNWKVVRSKEKE